MRERRTHGSVRGLRREPLVYSTGSKDEGISQTYSQWGMEERAHENFHQRKGAGDYDMVDTTEYKDMLRASMIGQMRNCDYYSSNPVSYREGRRIIGREYLDVKRAIRNQGISEPMTVAMSIIDNHGKTVVDFSRMGFATGIVKHKFVIPMGCFIPKDIDGLLVGGKAISVDRDTISVVRMVADIQNAGYALGYLAGRMAKNDGKAVAYEEIRVLQNTFLRWWKYQEFLQLRILKSEDLMHLSGVHKNILYGKTLVFISHLRKILTAEN